MAKGQKRKSDKAELDRADTVEENRDSDKASDNSKYINLSSSLYLNFTVYISHAFFILYVANIKELSLLNILSPKPSTSAEECAANPTPGSPKTTMDIFDVKDLVVGITYE